MTHTELVTEARTLGLRLRITDTGLDPERRGTIVGAGPGGIAVQWDRGHYVTDIPAADLDHTDRYRVQEKLR